jgi:hypothetical protein
VAEAASSRSSHVEASLDHIPPLPLVYLLTYHQVVSTSRATLDRSTRTEMKL